MKCHFINHRYLNSSVISAHFSLEHPLLLLGFLSTFQGRPATITLSQVLLPTTANFKKVIYQYKWNNKNQKVRCKKRVQVGVSKINFWKY